MFLTLITPIRFVALLSGALLVSSLFAGESNAARAKNSNIHTVNSLTHLAYIPAASQLETIRFEKVRMVSLPASMTSDADADYCSGLAFRDPGGSMFCPSTETISRVPAYEVTYSFIGQPMASDNSQGRRFTFSVYFSPQELGSELRQALSVRKPSRADTAGFFTLNTQRPLVQQLSIDDAQSTFCPGSHVDGTWTHDDQGCRDQIRYKTVTRPSDYVAVSVNPSNPAGFTAASLSH